MRRSCWGSPLHPLIEKQKGCVGCTCCPPVPLTRNIQSQSTCDSSRKWLAEEWQIKIFFIKLYEILIMIQLGTDSERMAGRDLCGHTVGRFARSSIADKTRLGYLWFYSSESCRPQRLETSSVLWAASSHVAPPSNEKAFPSVQLGAPKLRPVFPALLPPATSQESLDPPPSPLGTSRLLLGPLSASQDQPGSHHDMVSFVQLISFYKLCF